MVAFDFVLYFAGKIIYFFSAFLDDLITFFLETLEMKDTNTKTQSIKFLKVAAGCSFALLLFAIFRGNKDNQEKMIYQKAANSQINDSMPIPKEIPKGMRAFNLPIYSNSMPDRALLHPGCIVDVSFDYRMPNSEPGDYSLIKNELRGIQILAISDEPIISNSEGGEERENSNSSRGPLFTLLVDEKQAENLSLAVENGNVSLSILSRK